MWQLHQFPLCPFSRKVRLLLSEKGVAYDLVRENPWERREGFGHLSPAYRTPAIHNPERGISLADSRAICEYFEETVDKTPMINGTAPTRAEIRRLVERMKKRLVYRTSPDSKRLRDALRLADEHLDYLDYLIDNRPWLAGATMSLADLAAAAQISVADYLGGIDWSGHEQARGWYSVFKSRPSFRPLLAERMDVIQPPSHYADVNA
ncbi:MAG: glutathione S-transferase [Novosphingobium sp. 16-62-11]|nr:MAG: glutathione S-transferase [Novosphingobium sp. 16-62-11]